MIFNLPYEQRNADYKSNEQINKTPTGFMTGWGTTTYRDSIEGWAPGAIFRVNATAVAGAQTYVNQGTSTTATWAEVSDAGVAGGFAMTSGSAISVGGTDILVAYANGMQDNGHDTVTATTGGATTGLIAQGARFVTITSDSADKQVSLPAATVGDEITLYVGANGCEIISAVAGDKINNVVVGATNELAMPATSFTQLRYWAADNWSAWGHTTAGVINATMTPNAL